MRIIGSLLKLFCLSGLLLAGGSLQAAEAAKAAEAFSNQDCLDCHSDKQTRKIDGKEVPLEPTSAEVLMGEPCTL